jgi:hypothetical protein
VFETGLPALPDDLRSGESVPVAYWVGPRFGAIKRISRLHDGVGTALDDEVEIYERTDDGWREVGNGSRVRRTRLRGVKCRHRWASSPCASMIRGPRPFECSIETVSRFSKHHFLGSGRDRVHR